MIAIAWVTKFTNFDMDMLSENASPNMEFLRSLCFEEGREDHGTCTSLHREEGSETLTELLLIRA